MASASSDSNVSDPTFMPSPSPSSPTAPRTESSTQAQHRAIRRAYQSTTPRSSPPKISIIKPTPISSKHKSSPNRSSPAPLRSSLTPSLHHPGPFTSSPSQSPSLPSFPHLRAPNHQQPRPTKRKSSTQSSSSSLSRSPSHSPQPSTSGSNSPPKPNLKLNSRSKPEQTHRVPPLPAPTTPDPTNTYHTRPNRYLGAPSTWRSWTTEERTVATSLDQMRAQDLSIHLYNAHVLRRKAEMAGVSSRSRSMSQSRSRSRSRSQSRGRNGGRPSKIVKGKQKARSSSAGDDGSDENVSSDRGDAVEQTTFMPPRVWTAWPLPPDEVPREEFLARTLLGSEGGSGEGYRRKNDIRPSAELEECLIAITSRVAKERWEARAWQDAGDEDSMDERSRKRKRRAIDNNGDTKVKVEVQEQRSGYEEQNVIDTGGQDSLPVPPPPSKSVDNSIQLFSSQVFAAPSPSESSSSEGTGTTTQKPVFSADDDQIRNLLLPFTRHSISQLDKLLLSLHKIQMNRRRKTIEVGQRGHAEVLGMAELFFDVDVVQRARQRCDALFAPMK